MTWLKDLFKAAYDLTYDQRRKTVRWASGIALVVLMVTIALAGVAATSAIGAESPLWEVSIKARMSLFDGFVGISRWTVAFVMAVVSWEVLDNSSVGVRIFHWHKNDPDMVRGAKKINAALVISALILACAWVMR